jgi:hypothetical protein
MREIRLTDNFGKTLFVSETNEKVCKLVVKDIAEGIYFIEVIQHGERLIQKVVVR